MAPNLFSSNVPDPKQSVLLSQKVVDLIHNLITYTLNQKLNRK